MLWNDQMKQSYTSVPSLLILIAPLWSGYLHHSLQFWNTIQFLFIKYTATVCAKKPGMEVLMTAHFDCSFQHQQNIGFWKVANIYFFALGLALPVRMGGYGMIWLIGHFYHWSNNSFCNFHHYVIWLPLQISPSAVGMLPEGIKSHNQFLHPLLSYYTFFLKGKALLQIAFRLMTEKVRTGKIAQAPARKVTRCLLSQPW